MEYRVLTDGKHFRVLIKRCLFWQTELYRGEDNVWASRFCSGRTFCTEEQAVEYVVKTYGTSAKRCRRWRDI